MADPLIAIKKTIKNEGGYTNNPADSGGPTMMGITQKDMPGKNLEELTEDEATSYYRENYWKIHFSEIQNQLIADKVFDMSVLLGIGTAVKILQIILQVPIDGAFGPGSLAALNAVDPFNFLQDYKTKLVEHAVDIIAKNPKDRVFFQGWVHRINS